MMATTIFGSVGKGPGVRNEAHDVQAVKRLLNSNPTTAKPPLKVDSTVTNELVSRIETFQRQELRMVHPDGRIDPGGPTLRALNALAVRNDTCKQTRKPYSEAFHLMFDPVAGVAGTFLITSKLSESLDDNPQFNYKTNGVGALAIPLIFATEALRSHNDREIVRKALNQATAKIPIGFQQPGWWWAHIRNPANEMDRSTLISLSWHPSCPPFEIPTGRGPWLLPGRSTRPPAIIISKGDQNSRFGSIADTLSVVGVSHC